MTLKWLQPQRSTLAACRCVSCLSRSAVGVRAGANTTTRSNGRLTILCYSTIIATAAAAESDRKRLRRDLLDAKIKDLETTLLGRIVTHDGQKEREEMRQASVKAGCAQCQPRDARGQANARRPHAAFQTLREERMRSLHADPPIPSQRVLRNPLSPPIQSRPSLIPVATTSAAMGEDQMPQHMLSDPKVTPPESGTTATRVLSEYSCAKLAIKLLLACGDHQLDTEQRLRADLAHLAVGIKRLHSLRTDAAFYGRLLSPQYDSGPRKNELVSKRLALNGQFKDIFYNPNSRHMTRKTMLMSIAQTLITSSVSPDVCAYATMISQLDRLQLFDEADMVIESLHERQMKLDSVSTAVVLEHYIKTDDLSAFHRYAPKFEAVELDISSTRRNSSYTTPAVGSPQPAEILVPLRDIELRLYHTLVRGYRHFQSWSLADSWEFARDRELSGVDFYVLAWRLEKLLSQRDTKPPISEVWSAWTSIKTALNGRDRLKIPQHDIHMVLFRLLRHLHAAQSWELHRKLMDEIRQRGYTMADVMDADQTPTATLVSAERERRWRLDLQTRLDPTGTVTRDRRLLELCIQAASSALAGASLANVRALFETRGYVEHNELWMKLRLWPWGRAYRRDVETELRPETRPAMSTDGSLPVRHVIHEAQTTTEARQSVNGEPSAPPSKTRYHLSYADYDLDLVKGSSHPMPMDTLAQSKQEPPLPASWKPQKIPGSPQTLLDLMLTPEPSEPGATPQSRKKRRSVLVESQRDVQHVTLDVPESSRDIHSPKSDAKVPSNPVIAQIRKVRI